MLKTDGAGNREREKRQHFDAIQLEIGQLWAEKRWLLIQQCSIPTGTNDNMESVVSTSIAEADKEITYYQQRISENDMVTSQKTNQSPHW